MSRQRVNRRSEVQWPLLADADRHEDLVRSLTETCNDHGPLVVGKVAEGQSGDTKLRLLNLFCDPCKSFIGWVASYEVGDRLPGHLPYFVLTRQIPRQIPGTATETGGWPEYQRCRVVLGDADDPWLQQLMEFHQLSPPVELATCCSVHGALTFTRRQMLGWATEARQRILDAELRGDTPRATRRKLRPPIVSAV